MIYKFTDVHSDFTMIQPLLQNVNYTYYCDELYVSDVHSQTKRRMNYIVTQIDCDKNNVKIIDEKTVDNEPIKIQEWCRKQLAWAKVISYEREEQNNLRNTMQTLQKIEQEIFNDRKE